MTDANKFWVAFYDGLRAQTQLLKEPFWSSFTEEKSLHTEILGIQLGYWALLVSQDPKANQTEKKQQLFWERVGAILNAHLDERDGYQQGLQTGATVQMRKYAGSRLKAWSGKAFERVLTDALFRNKSELFATEVQNTWHNEVRNKGMGEGEFHHQWLERNHFQALTQEELLSIREAIKDNSFDAKSWMERVILNQAVPALQSIKQKPLSL